MFYRDTCILRFDEYIYITQKCRKQIQVRSEAAFIGPGSACAGEASFSQYSRK